MIASPRRSPLRSPSLLAAAAALAAATALTACTPSGELPGPTTSASPSASESPNASPSPSPSASAVGADEERAANLADAVTSGNTAAIEGYLSDPTRVLIAASEADGQYSPVDAVLAVDYVQPGVGSWEFSPEESVLAVFAGNPYYGEFFTDDAVVGISDAGAVIAFVPAGPKIGTIFMSIDEALISDY